MHAHSLKNWRHNHDFVVPNAKGERRVNYVLLLTAATMVVEIAAGSVYGSMALLADGWHMGTHVAAFLIALFAYRFARRHAGSPAYTFGAGKVNVLGGFASAVALAVVALLMVIESLQRAVEPQPIRFDEAILVAGIGLLVNVVCALLLKEGHDHGHPHSHEHHQHHDHNLKAAYLHVLADALTSLLAIGALVAGKYFGWHWLDPMMGLVGGVIIARWSYGLLKQTAPILLDASAEREYRQSILDAIERDADNRVYDIHVWRVGAEHYAAIIALVTHHPRSADYYKGLLTEFRALSHITVEVNTCRDTVSSE